jgi:hypothetical protein
MEKFKNIIVKRQGTTSDSFLITKDIISEIKPKKNYILKNNKLLETNLLTNLKTKTNLSQVKYAKLFGNWNKNLFISNSIENNILGDTNIFDSYFDTLDIPIEIATSEKLDYYDCKLIEENDIFTFDTLENLPLTKVSIGEKYLENFILQENFGNGFYLEYHNNPHFHMPCNKNSKGYLILAKRITQLEYHLTAFIIPFGKAIYMPPYVMHNDCCLIGDYYVVYSKSTEFSTANLYHKNTLVKINFIKNV